MTIHIHELRRFKRRGVLVHLLIHGDVLAVVVLCLQLIFLMFDIYINLILFVARGVQNDMI